MQTWLITGVVIALLVNLITLFLDRKVALRIIPCLFFYIFIVIGYEILNISQVRMAAMEFIKKCPGWPSYLVIVILCIILGTAVFWSLNVAVNKIDKATDKEEKGKVPQPPVSPPSVYEKQFTPEEIAKAVKKEIAPQLKGNETIKYPPDLTKAKQTLINSLDQFNPDFGMKLKDVKNIVPGYFELLADPVPSGGYYSHSAVTTKKQFSTHFYASVRFAPIENVQTMDFAGRDIWCVIDPAWKAILIWETEQLQTPWLTIEVEVFSNNLNTLAIYQKNKNVDIYINNHYVRSYKKLKQPEPGPIAIAIKANALKGGKMFFRDFSVWDFGN
jgi:hypothetical protein